MIIAKDHHALLPDNNCSVLVATVDELDPLAFQYPALTLPHAVVSHHAYSSVLLHHPRVVTAARHPHRLLEPRQIHAGTLPPPVPPQE